jgi:hypothetical protein
MPEPLPEVSGLFFENIIARKRLFLFARASVNGSEDFLHVLTDRWGGSFVKTEIGDAER